MKKICVQLLSMLFFIAFAYAESPRKELQSQAGFLSHENIFEEGKFFKSCHASTILESKNGDLLVAYFAGDKEGAKNVSIWLSKFKNGKWLSPRKIADSTMTIGIEAPCWNPVLFRLKDGKIVLYFKQSGGPRNWTGMQSFSDDEGETWSKPEELKPAKNCGPIKNKPVYVGNRLIAPTSDEFSGDDWRVFFWLSDNDGKTWERTDYVNQENEAGGIQPSILIHKNGWLQAVGRTVRGSEYIYQTWSKDNGKTWSKLTSTGLPNNNSGTDAVSLKDGRHLIVYNHTTNWTRRYPLNLSISDDGIKWFPVMILDDTKRELSYPAIIQRENGLVDIVYTNGRKTISHIVIDPSKIIAGKKALSSNWDMSDPEYTNQKDYKKKPKTSLIDKILK